MVGAILIFLLSFVICAFLSGTEMAFITVNTFKLRELADEGNRGRVLYGPRVSSRMVSRNSTTAD